MTGRQARARASPTARRSPAPTRPCGLHRRFFASPYRPTGLTTAARAVVRLVDELRWLNTIVLRPAPITRPPTPTPARAR